MAFECEPRYLSRRQLLKGALLAGGGALLSACAPTAPQVAQEPQVVEQTVTVKETVVVKEPAKATGPIIIRVSVWGDTGDRMANGAIADLFNETNENIKVIDEQYPGGYYEKIIANFAGGKSADVLYFQPWTWQAYADQGVLVAIDDLIEKDGWTKPWVAGIQIYENYCKWHGSTYETPADAGADPIYYNKDLFDMRGVPYPKDDWTLDDLKATIEKMTFEEKGVKYYGWALANGWNGIFGRFQNLWRTEGALEFDQIVESKKAQWDDPIIAEALQYFVTEVVAKGFCPSPSAISGGGVSIASGRVAMCIEGPWILPAMYGQLASKPGGINFDVVMQPKGKAGYVDAETSLSGYVISKQTKDREACWEYIKFYTTEPAQTQVATYGRMCSTPELQEKIWAPIASKSFNFQNTSAFIKTQNEPKAHGFMVGGKGGDMNAFYDNGAWPAWDELVAGKRTAKEILKDFNVKQQKMLDDYWQKRG